MIVTELSYTVDLDRGVSMTPFASAFLGGDQEAHRIIVDCYRGREAIDLAAAGVTAYFVRADGMTIPLTGGTDGNKASVLLPAACYAAMGRFSLVIKLSLGDSINTVFWGEGAISRSRTDVVIDPDSVIPSLDDLLAQIDAMEKATAAANAAAESVEGFKAEIKDEISQLNEDISDISVPDGETLALDIKPGHVDIWGAIFYDKPDYAYTHTIARVAVEPGQRYAVRCSYAGTIAGVSFFGANDKFISVALSGGSAKTEEKFNHIIVVPDGATTMYISSLYGAPMGAMRVSGVKLDTAPLSVYLENALDAVDNGSPILGGNLAADYTAARLIDGTTGEIVTSESSAYVVSAVSVQEGERYHIDCASARSYAAYAFYDKNGHMIGGSGPVDPGATTEKIIRITKNVTIPFGCDTLKLCHYITQSVPVAKKVHGYGDSATWHHLKWACIGDSLTEHNGRTDKNYHDYVHDNTGIQVINMGVSGTGYMKRNEEGLAFYQRAANIPSDADVVTIFGSGNDLSNPLGNPTDTGTDTICGCINATIDQVYSVLPTVQLGIVAPTPWINNTPEDDGSMARLTEALEAICMRRSIPFLDLFHGSGLRPNDAIFRSLAYSKDDGNGVHPDETGHKMISGRFFVFLDSLIGTY